VLLVLLVVSAVAFVAGMSLGARVVPRTPATASQRLAMRTVDLLFGAAAAVVAANVWIAVDTIAQSDDAFLSVGVAQTAVYAVTSALWEGGTLAALAVIVHLLGHRAPAATD